MEEAPSARTQLGFGDWFGLPSAVLFFCVSCSDVGRALEGIKTLSVDQPGRCPCGFSSLSTISSRVGPRPGAAVIWVLLWFFIFVHNLKSCWPPTRGCCYLGVAFTGPLRRCAGWDWEGCELVGVCRNCPRCLSQATLRGRGLWVALCPPPLFTTFHPAIGSGPRTTTRRMSWLDPVARAALAFLCCLGRTGGLGTPQCRCCQCRSCQRRSRRRLNMRGGGGEGERHGWCLASRRRKAPDTKVIVPCFSIHLDPDNGSVRRVCGKTFVRGGRTLSEGVGGTFGRPTLGEGGCHKRRVSVPFGTSGGLYAPVSGDTSFLQTICIACAKTLRNSVFWEVRVGQPLLCSQVLLLPLGVPPTPAQRVAMFEFPMAFGAF